MVMSKRKYVFEVKGTRLKRQLRSFLFFTFIFLISYSLYCLGFIFLSKNENTHSKEFYKTNTPDLIAVFTGDLGRISFALKKAREFKNSKILITGVYPTNSSDTLLKLVNFGDKIDPNIIEIDYLARNTVENVLSTLRHIRKNKSYKNILIISNDYHILRIKMIVQTLTSENESLNFHYSGIKTNFSNFRNLKILFTEGLKLLRTVGFLLVWDQEGNI